VRHLGEVPRRQEVPELLKRGPITIEAAAAAGFTRFQLRGVNWRRISWGVYEWAGGTESDLHAHLGALRYRLPNGCVFSHRTAARIHGVDVVLRTIPLAQQDVTAPGRVRMRTSDDLRVHTSSLCAEDTTSVAGLPCTRPLRTAFDLARHLPLVEAVAAVDALLHSGKVNKSALHTYIERHAHWSGVVQSREVVELAEPASESLMESVLRMALIRAGCPRPAVQHWICDRHRTRIGRVDLWYEGARLAIEYDGDWHRDNLVRDNRRQNAIRGQGVQLLRFTAADVLQRPDMLVAQVRAHL
jgi:hypothetical protein